MSSEKEQKLTDSVRETLEINGEIEEIKSDLRTIITKMKNSNSNNNETNCSPNVIVAEDKQLSEMCKKINKMIMEYVLWYGYQYTSEMFSLESNEANEPSNTLENIDANALPEMLMILLEKQNSINEMLSNE